MSSDDRSGARGGNRAGAARDRPRRGPAARRRRLRGGVPDLERRVRRPPARRSIVRCGGAADVIAAVGFARSNDLPIAVRGGGHSVAGFSTCDDGMVIDLSPMSAVRRRPGGAARVRRRAAPSGRDVDHETQAHGLATTGGLVSTPASPGSRSAAASAGLMRKFGLACDNLVGADVVTADGRLVHASETENARAALGPARRRRQLRHRHAVRVRRSTRSGRSSTRARCSTRPRTRSTLAARVPRVGARRAGRDHGADQPDKRAAAAGDPGGVARQEGRRAGRRLDGPGRRGRSARPRRCAAVSRADRRPARPDALQGDADADRPAVAEGDPRLLQGHQPGPARRRADRAAVQDPPRRAGAAVRDPRAPDGRCGRRASPRARRHSRSARCRSC